MRLLLGLLHLILGLLLVLDSSIQQLFRILFTHLRLRLFLLLLLAFRLLLGLLLLGLLGSLLTLLLALGGLYSDLEAGFCKKLDVLTTQMLSPSFLNTIRPEEVLIYARQ